VIGEGGVSPKDYYRHQYKLFFLLSRIRKPFFPYVQGKCTGSGVGLALNSTLGVGTETASFSFNSCRVGLPIEGGSTHFLSKLPAGLGKLIAFTGYFVFQF
jgi:enoyl-CoA hydratase